MSLKERKKKHTTCSTQLYFSCTTIIMGRNLLLYLSKDEKLAEAVSKYPCLHDMSCSNYKNQICLGNVLVELDREMGFEKGKIKVVYLQNKKSLKDNYIKEFDIDKQRRFYSHRKHLSWSSLLHGLTVSSRQLKFVRKFLSIKSCIS